MAFIPVDKTAMVEVRMFSDGQKIENTLYFEYADAPTAGQLSLLGSAILDWWDTNVKPLVPTTVILREIYVTDLTSASSAAVSVVPSGTDSGTASGEAMPNNVSLAVSFRTASRGRSFRGRNYWPGFVIDAVNGNSVPPATSDAIQDAYVALLTVADDTGTTWVVVSRFTGNAPRSAGVTTPITTVLIVDGTIDSMRRRLPGRGT
jgi:hypothetical protein